MAEKDTMSASAFPMLDIHIHGQLQTRAHKDTATHMSHTKRNEEMERGMDHENTSRIEEKMSKVYGHCSERPEELAR